MGAFRPPVPEGQDTCYISDHVDIALGINSASPNQEAARTFLEWMTTQEFAELYTNQLPGFFTLSDHEISVDDPIAAEFLSWRGECESTIRSSYQILSRGEPNLENELWRVSALLLNGEMTAQEAADTVQQGLESWYEPQMEG
jgi:raffinose/stachyose/melibiose transport system substrate-binding protein